MTLGQFLPLIASNAGLRFTIFESDGHEVITFYAAGYAAISDELKARELNEIVLTDEGMKYIKLYLKAVPTAPEVPTDGGGE